MKNYKVYFQGMLSGMALTKDKANGITVFSEFHRAKDALKQYAFDYFGTTNEKKELIRCVNGIQEKRLDWDETHIEL